MMIYISGPMTGLPNLNFGEFERVAKQLYEKGYEVINPADIEQPDKSWEACMRKDIVELMKADAVALLKGWEQSNGARLEVSIASALKMPVLDAYTLEPITLSDIPNNHLREALEFYADEDNWRGGLSMASRINVDGGERARNALNTSVTVPKKLSFAAGDYHKINSEPSVDRVREQPKCKRCEDAGGLVRYGNKGMGEPDIVRSYCDCEIGMELGKEETEDESQSGSG